MLLAGRSLYQMENDVNRIVERVQGEAKVVLEDLRFYSECRAMAGSTEAAQTGSVRVVHALTPVGIAMAGTRVRSLQGLAGAGCGRKGHVPGAA